MDKTVMSKLISEGPLLISTREIMGDDVLNELKCKIVAAIEKGYLVNEESTHVLILTGSHGNEAGHSVLTDIELHDEQLYIGDCLRVGLKPIISQKLSVSKHNIPDILKKMEKLNPLHFGNSFLSDDAISKITFKVTNIAYYHQNKKKLIKDIKIFSPKVLALAWCYSMKSDVAMVLREEGMLARMIIEHDMREISKKPNAKLDDNQAKIIEKIANEKPQNIILWGSSGTGKTLLIAQALSMKISQYLRQKLISK